MFLQYLGPVSISLLKSIFNKSWAETKVPLEWRPIPKGGKDLQKMESYGSISLTSTIGKTMEHLVANRLQNFAESMHLLTEHQAGFRHGCSIEDQLLRLSQSISDGFQQSPMQRTVVALIVYSRAYDKVWRDALLMKMSKVGIQDHMVRWIQSWLSNRLTFVTFDGVRSQTVTLKQYVLQGSSFHRYFST